MKINLVEDLNKYRKNRKLTYRDLASQLDTTPDIVWDLLNDRRRFIDLNVLHAALDLLNKTEEG